MAKDDSPLDSGMCAHCDVETQGRSYRYFYGRKLDSSSLDLGVVAVTETTFRVGGSDKLFLCARCVRHANLAGNIGGCAVFFLVVIPVLSVVLPRFVIGILFCLGVVGTLLALSSNDVTIDEGEAAAQRLARKRKLHGGGTTYWTTKEYEKLERKRSRSR